MPRRQHNTNVNYNPRTVTLGGHAKFQQGSNHWTSHHAKATFRLLGNGRIIVETWWGQQGQNATKKNKFARPDFNDDELDRMFALAETIFEERSTGDNRRRRNNNSPREADKHHRRDLCERCQHLGRNCTGI